MSLVVLDAAIANVALPTIERSLEITSARSVLVITAYQTALVMALLPSAALGESAGYRRVFMSGVALFTAASVACALSRSLPWLLAARFVQGLGGAAVMALGVALLRQIVPQARLGAAIGWNATTVALSSAAGPAIGAVILSAWSWPWLFAINLPLGALALLLGHFLPRISGSARRVDAVSAGLNAGTFGAFVLAAEWAPSAVSLSAASLTAAAAGLVVLIRRELPRQAPLIPFDLLRSRPFRLSVVASVCCFIGQAAGMTALPFYLQHNLHLTAWSTGLLMTPWPLTVALMAPFTGRLADTLPSAWLCAAGGLLLALGLAGIATGPFAGNAVSLVPFIMMCGLGFGLFQVPNNREMFLAAPPERSGAAGGIQGTARLTGQTIGALL
ncbi:MAG TPA: MFS transporter, partial [Bradyrhizobium sp.]